MKLIMPNKKYVGKLISIKYTDRPSPIYGFVIDYNNDWTLLKYNPFDFVIDGYIILRHKNIEGFRRSSEEKFREKIIKLKKLNEPDCENIPLTTIDEILSYLSGVYGIFGIERKSEKKFYLGKLQSSNKSKVIVKSLNPKGAWAEQMEFRSNDIRSITFQNDYINSLKLLLE